MNFRICEGGTVRHQGRTYYPGEPLVLTNRRDAMALIQIGRIAPDPEADAADEAKAKAEAEAAPPETPTPPEPEPTPPEPEPVPEPEPPAEAAKIPAKPAAKK